jgi:hypothetical protein
MTSVVSRSRCPRCAKEGKDNSENNLVTYDDGHVHCYSCSYHRGGDVLYSIKYKLKATDHANQLVDNLPHYSDSDSNATFDIPERPLQWLHGYGITDDEIHSNQIWYDLRKDLLVFPIYNGSRLMATSARYFGSLPKHPKYLTSGLKNNHFKLFARRESDVYVLVEDFVSAIKVGRHFNCIPLLGCVAPVRLVLSLVPSRPILRLWLDSDKNISSIDQVQRMRQYIPDCASILTEKDPKCYDDSTIKKIVNAYTPELAPSDTESTSRIYSLPQV